MRTKILMIIGLASLAGGCQKIEAQEGQEADVLAIARPNASAVESAEPEDAQRSGEDLSLQSPVALD